MTATPGASTRLADRLAPSFFGNALRVSVALLRRFRRG